jgi:hypothetical protein
MTIRSRSVATGDETLRRLELALGSNRSAVWVPAAWLALFFISNVRFSGFRDPALAASGIASPENLVELAVFYFVGLLAAMHLLVTHQRLRSSGLWLVGLLGALATVSSLWSRVSLFSFVRGSQLVIVAILAAASASIWASRKRDMEKDWKRIWSWYVGIMAVATMISLAVGSYVGGRFTWPGQHPGTTGEILGIGVLVALSMILEPGWSISRRMRALLGVLVIGGVIAMALTVSRTAILGLIASVVVLLVATNRGRLDLRLLFVVGVLTVAGLGVVLFAEQIFGFVARGADIDELLTLTGRTELWGFALQVMGRSPIGGFGYGAGRLVLSEEIQWAGTGHNLWVESAISLGGIGVLLVTAVIVWLVFTSIDLQRRAPGAVGNLAIPLVVFESIGAVTGSSFALPGTSLTVTALLVAAIAAERRISARSRSRRHFLS